MSLPSLLISRKETLTALCKEHHAEKLYLFGSAATDQFTPNSNLDMILRFRLLNVPPEDQGQLYWNLFSTLEQLLVVELIY